MSTWDIGGRIFFRAKLNGKRAKVEQDADTMTQQICMELTQKYPGFIFDRSEIAISQQLSEQVKG